MKKQKKKTTIKELLYELVKFAEFTKGIEQKFVISDGLSVSCELKENGEYLLAIYRKTVFPSNQEWEVIIKNSPFEWETPKTIKVNNLYMMFGYMKKKESVNRL